jgi:two-component system, LytTR family, response regulator
MIRSLLIDDEVAARGRLARLLVSHPEIEIAGQASDGLAALEQISALTPDLLFLDIDMPGLNGFEVLRALPPDSAVPLVVFVTAYNQHAMAAFEANALAYLLKPVNPDRLARVIERAKQVHAHASHRLDEQRQVGRLLESAPRALVQVVARKRDRFVLLSPAEVIFFQVDTGIVKAKTATDSYWVNHQLNELEEGLPEGLFFRARREVLVNLARVADIRPYFKSSFLLTMADAARTEIAVSERQAKLLRQRLPGL